MGAGVKAIGQVVKGLSPCQTNAVSFLSFAGANFVFHFSSGVRTIRMHEAVLPVRKCALDYHKSTDKKCSGQSGQAFLGEIKGLIESTVPGETND